MYRIFSLRGMTRITWLSGTETLTVLSSSRDDICMDRLLEPLFDRESSGGLLFVAPRPASKLFNKEGLRAQIKAWKEDTVKTPSLFRVCFVARETWVSRLWKKRWKSTFHISAITLEIINVGNENVVEMNTNLDNNSDD